MVDRRVLVGLLLLTVIAVFSLEWVGNSASVEERPVAPGTVLDSGIRDCGEVFVASTSHEVRRAIERCYSNASQSCSPAMMEHHEEHYSYRNIIKGIVGDACVLRWEHEFFHNGSQFVNWTECHSPLVVVTKPGPPPNCTGPMTLPVPAMRL